MQEKFVMKTVKRIAAISTGVAMLGATLTGALAAPQLKEYPSPFVKMGVYDDSNVFVVGDNAAASDTLGLVDISTNLQFMAKTPVSTGGQSVAVTGGQTKAVPLGRFSLANNSDLFDRQMDNGDVSSMFKGKINFKGTDYDVEEQLQFPASSIATEPTIATSLQSSDDDYKTDVAMEFQKDSIKYAYRFVDTINLSSGAVTTTNKLKLNVLGTPLRLTSVSAESFDAQVGEEHFLAEGDSVTVDGKVVKLEAVGTANAVVSVDGESRVIATEDSQTLNGVEVTIDSVISKTNKGDSSAVIVVGKDSKNTYNDGDAFPGEDIDTPNWVWDLSALTTSGSSSYTEFGGSTAVKVLRVENDIHFEDDSDKGPRVGGCLALPNDYLQICLDSFSVSEDNYKELEMKVESSADLDVAFANTSVKALKISIPVDDGLLLPDYTGTPSSAVANAYANGLRNETSSVKTKEVYLYTADGEVNLSGRRVLVYYKDFSATPNKVKLHGALSTNASLQEILELNYDSTKSENMVLLLDSPFDAATKNVTKMNLTWNINGDSTADMVNGADDLITSWGLTTTGFTALGDSASSEEDEELVWGSSATHLGTKDEDHRMLYGIKLLNPKSSSSSDKVRMVIPNDQVKVNVVIKGKSATVSSGGTSYVPAKVTPKSMLSSEVSDPTLYNLIVVGGPCANPLAETLFGVSCDGWSLQEGEAMLKLADNGNKVALLVAGTTATDTRRAAKALAASETYLKDTAKSEALVKGATLSDVNVE